MCKSPRPIITLLIDNDSPLAEGRLPIKATRSPQGIKARFDPVSYGALRASIGDVLLLEEVTEMMVAAAREASEKLTEASNSHNLETEDEA